MIEQGGWFNVYKPRGVNSTKVVSVVKRVLKQIHYKGKVGHAGTLDPLAEGVLPVAVGQATKLVPYLMEARKEYEFVIQFGRATDTDDAEGKIIATSGKLIEKKSILQILPKFIGSVEQVPSKYSAIKVDGARAYDLARAGEEFELKSRRVEIFSLELLGFEVTSQQARLVVSCGKGTYVRAIARDLAIKLGSVGHVIFLKRKKVGVFTEKNAISLEFLTKIVHNAPLDIAPECWALQKIGDFCLPLLAALDDILGITVDHFVAERVRNGSKVFLLQDLPQIPFALLCDGELVAMVVAENGYIKSLRVFN